MWKMKIEKMVDLPPSSMPLCLHYLPCLSLLCIFFGKQLLKKTLWWEPSLVFFMWCTCAAISINLNISYPLSDHNSLSPFSLGTGRRSIRSHFHLSFVLSFFLSSSLVRKEAIAMAEASAASEAASTTAAPFRPVLLISAGASHSAALLCMLLLPPY